MNAGAKYGKNKYVHILKELHAPITTKSFAST